MEWKNPRYRDYFLLGVQMKRIGETYKWRNPTIIDRHPELIEFLKNKPKYIDAWALRKFLLAA